MLGMIPNVALDPFRFELVFYTQALMLEVSVVGNNLSPFD